MHKGLVGFAKYSVFVLALVAVACFAILNTGVVSAAHTPIVTISPNIANCDQLGDTFTVHVANDPLSTDGIYEVRIYKSPTGLSSFSCGLVPPPVGWTLSDYAGGDPNLPNYGYCEYKTVAKGPNVIAPGTSKDFKFNAVMIQEGCTSTFTISTLDDAFPMGEHKYSQPTVAIDCKAPLITKVVGDPKILIDPSCNPQTQTCDYWIMRNTPISLSATDNQVCDLGIDYCEYKVTVDGTVVTDWTKFSADGFQLPSFKEDSNHKIEVRCFDNAGNPSYITETDKVDSTPPVTTKVYGDPHFPAGINDGVPYPHYITSQTPITLTPVDPDPTTQGCNIGVEKTWWYDTIVDDHCCNPILDGQTSVAACGPVCPSPYEKVQCVTGGTKGGMECVENAQTQCITTDNPKGSQAWAQCVEDMVNTNCVSCTCTGPTAKWRLYQASGPFQKPEESCHIIQYFSVDELGNIEPMKLQFVYVDNKPPVGVKTVGDPKIVIPDDLEKLGKGNAEWSTAEHNTGMYSAKLVIPDGAVGTDFAGVDRILVEPVSLDKITSLSYYRKVTQYKNGWNPIIILGIDTNGNGVFDAKPLEWQSGTDGSRDPSLLGGDSMIQCEAQTGLTGLDSGFVNVDAYNTFACYVPTLDGKSWDWAYYQPLSYFQKNNVNNIKTTDKVVFVKVELGGNPTTQDNEIAYVDTVKLNGNIVIDEPTSWWVTKNTQITMTCNDQDPHPVDHTQVCYRITVDEAQPGEFNCVDSPKTITFAEDSNHQLDYYCKDALGNKGPIDSEKFKVDTTPPAITKTMLGIEGQDYLGACPPKSADDKCYVRDNGVGGVHVAVSDGGRICAVDQTTCDYKVWWTTTQENCGDHQYVNGKCLIDVGRFGDEGKDIVFSHDSTHDLVIDCQDALGNAMSTDTETFLVDSTPPVTTKTYGSPTVVSGSGAYRWITSDTPITLTATDAKVGVDKITWRVTPLFIPDEGCVEDCNYAGSEPWQEITGVSATFKIGEESCHLIEFQSVDKLGNLETLKRQCVFVEDTPPVTTKVVGDPKVVIGDKTYINQQTEITMRCVDPTPHPVDKVTMKYRYRFAENCEGLPGAEWSEWNTYDGSIQFTEDSCHELEYYCEDALGNEEVHQFEVDVVDTKAPVITTSIVGPSIVIGENTYIDTVTKIHVEASDPVPHPVDNVKCEWSYILDGKENIFGGDDQSPPLDITFPEETQHELHIKCWDALKNKAEVVETYYADHTPPVTTKSYGTPFFNNDVSDWITSATPITLTVDDAGPHKTGIKETNYRVTLMESDAPCQSESACAEATGSGDWQTYSDEPFTIGQESCHLIEYYSVDNVEKTEVTKKQCVFVDNSAPNPDKKVGNPKDQWTPGLNGDPVSYYYPEANTQCWNGQENQIECWQVTLLTPISLECVDPQPHPVDHETVCFKVGWDGDWVTQQYCQGDLTGDGFCCVDKEVPFYFGRTSEHELEYYCIDALGNKGQTVDIEKFKVEDTSFNITINKKWNLISTPVFLLDDSMDKVFKDVPGCVKSVWTYDAVAKEWHIYTPDGNPANDDLTSMVPGDGYWALANDECVLQIGGSLMRPGPMGQASKPIVSDDWNLIGFYGTEGLLEYDGPNLGGEGKPAQCALYSLGPSLLDKELAALNTYWEPDNPYQWKGLNNYDYMNPGAGYWLYTPQSGLYTPTTSCGGFITFD